jgi:hypothetical protein
MQNTARQIRAQRASTCVYSAEEPRTPARRAWPTIAGRVFAALLAVGLSLGWQGAPPRVDRTGEAFCRTYGGVSACFAPGTTPEGVENGWRQIRRLMRVAPYNASNRWTYTSTNGSVPSGPITLTYSFVPDVDTGDPETSNSLHAVFDNQFGSRAAWQNLFRSFFEEWGQKSGITFVETTDDGAPWPNSPGVTGVRGDIRIVAQPIDGQYGTLAYNYFPNWGDMTLDTAENWANAAQTYRFLRNTFMHEVGHGLGLDHVDPVDNTKLMEPYLNSNFSGPQDDDIRGVQQYYGDNREPNGSAATATNLGAAAGTTIEHLSLTNSSDVDWYRVTASAGSALAITATPVGATYDVGPHEGTTSNINTRKIQKLRVRVYDPAGNTIRGEAVASSTGDTVTLNGFVLSGESYLLIQVSSGGGSNDVQRYTLGFASIPTEPVTLTLATNATTPPTITASPADDNDLSSATPPATLDYSLGQTVTLTAPPTAGTQNFVRWQLDNVPQTLGQKTLSVPMNGSRTATAQYSNTLVVEISGPSTVPAGQGAQLTATVGGGVAPYSYAWTPAATVASPTSATTNVTPAATTQYKVTVTDSNGATGSATHTVAIAQPLVVNAGPDRVLLPGQTYTMAGSASGGIAPYTYQWSPVTNLTDPTSPVTTLTALAGRVYTLTVTDSNGDQATDTVKIDIAAPLSVALNGEERIDAGESVSLSALVSGGHPPFEYTWTENGVPLPESGSMVTRFPSASTVYAVTVTDAANQVATASLHVTVAAPLAVTLSASSNSIASGGSTRLTATVTGGVPPYEIYWNPSNWVDDPEAFEVTANPPRSTTFTAIVYDSADAVASASTVITVSGIVVGQGTDDDEDEDEDEDDFDFGAVPAPVGGCGFTGAAMLSLSFAGLRLTRGRRR